MATLSADPAGDVTIVASPTGPSDTVDLYAPFRSIRVTVAGNVQITTMAGNKRVCAFLDGETRPLCGTRIWNTLTTATGIEAYH